MVGFKIRIIKSSSKVKIILVFDRWCMFFFKLVVIEIMVKLIMFVIIVIWILVFDGRLNK